MTSIGTSHNYFWQKIRWLFYFDGCCYHHHHYVIFFFGKKPQPGKQNSCLKYVSGVFPPPLFFFLWKAIVFHGNHFFPTSCSQHQLFQRNVHESVSLGQLWNNLHIDRFFSYSTYAVEFGSITRLPGTRIIRMQIINNNHICQQLEVPSCPAAWRSVSLLVFLFCLM